MVKCFFMSTVRLKIDISGTVGDQAWRAIRPFDQLQSAGLRASNIYAAEFCTACRTDLFFSHRKEGAHTGRMMAVVGIKPRPD